jgi:hypothetical protein
MPAAEAREAREASTVVLVEGGSDRRALLALARRLGYDLASAGAEIVAMDGVTNLRSHVAELDRLPAQPRILGLYDIGEAATVGRMLSTAGRMRSTDGRADAAWPAALEAQGFFACSLDLEDELIRAAGPSAIEAVLGARGDLAPFRTFQRQPAQRARPIAAQLHRFAGTAAGRKTWFAADVVEVLPLDRVPRGMARLLERAMSV